MRQLSREQRYTIFVMLKEKSTQSSIAKAIGVSKTAISREIKRNSLPGKQYNYNVAQKLYQDRMKSKRKHAKFTDSMKNAVQNLLCLDWSPEQNSGFCKKKGMDIVNHETIYRFIWKDKMAGGKMYTHLRRRGRHNQKRSSQYVYRGLIPNRIDIEEHPQIVNQKERFGDLDRDLIVGKDHKGAILTLNDRMTSLSWSKKLSSKNSDEVAAAVIELLLPFKGYLHTLTFDNGREFAHHNKISEALGISVFFAKPYQSWERGANENLNGLYRQYIYLCLEFSNS